jgi:type I restriction enzyme S subunit
VKGEPKDWSRTELSNIALVIMGQSPDSRSYNDEGRGLPFFQGKAEFGKLFPTIKKWCTEPTKIAETGDILLSVRAPVGPTNLAAEKCCIGRGLASIRAYEPIDSIYLLHYFRNIESWLSQQGTGTTFTAISGDYIRSLDVPVAPLEEQKRIADKLDNLLTRVDACRERLDRVPLILKRFRQSVLAAATTGQLTEDWRNQNRYEADISVSWDDAVLLDICQTGRVITYGVIKLGDEIPDGVPCLRTSNVRWLRVDTQGMKRISSTLSAEYSRTVLEGTEVLVNVRGTLGGVAAVTPEMVGWNVSREVAVVPVDAMKVHSTFLTYWIGSEASQRWLRGVEKGVAYIGINIEDLRTLHVKLPSIDEQIEIVRRVEILFAFADRLETRLSNARKQTERLIPSLLAKAFRGELVPQDPNNEPASVLLERIRSRQVSQPDRIKRITVERRIPMTTLTRESVEIVISEFADDPFSFDDIRKKLHSGNYDEIKNILFVMLEDSDPLIRQVYDKEDKAIRFVRRKK